MWFTTHHILGLITNLTTTVPARSPRWRRRQTPGPVYRSIIVIDMAGSARWHNQEQLLARSVLRTAVRAAVQRAGITWTDLAIEDRGDGMIILVPPSVSKVDILDPVMPSLAEAISAHNASVAATFQIRLRVAVHAGEVHRDGQGWVGRDIITACRLVNGQPLYRRLRHRPRTNLVLVISDLIYQSVVRHHYRDINPTAYTRIRVSAKELNTEAWLHTPGSPPPRRHFLTDLRQRLGWRSGQAPQLSPTE